MCYESLTYLNAIIVYMWLCIKGLGSLICTRHSEFTHSSPEVWQNLSGWRLDGRTPGMVCVVWQALMGTSFQTGQPRLVGTVSSRHRTLMWDTLPGVWKAQLLGFCIYLAGWPSTALRVLICQPVVLGVHNKPEIKQIMLSINVCSVSLEALC